jgi:hypothetical protein
MKKSKKLLLIFVTALVLASPSLLFAQEKAGQPKLKTVTVYDEKFDNLISKKVIESQVTYDIKGNILEEIEYTGTKVTKHFQYQYDADGNKIKEIEFDPSGKVSKTSEYKIDSRGLRTEKTIFGTDGKLKTRKTYVYTTF